MENYRYLHNHGNYALINVSCNLSINLLKSVSPNRMILLMLICLNKSIESGYTSEHCFGTISTKVFVCPIRILKSFISNKAELKFAIIVAVLWHKTK